MLGHWGASPALSFVYTHLNRAIRNCDLDMIFMAGPGHGAPGVLAPVYLEGSYSEIYPDKSQDEEGLLRFFKQFSFPGGIGSHALLRRRDRFMKEASRACPLSRVWRALTILTDRFGWLATAAERGTHATSRHITKFLNPILYGAVLPY
jgi:xylulose-5-phosphate/fructose-6-phosphate phosphoketolase